jgi:hypothetical protein
VKNSRPPDFMRAKESRNIHVLGEPEDQVARRMRFSEAHPEVTFSFMRDTGRWEATYPAKGDGTQKICFTELRHVLDELEKRLGKPPTPEDGKVTDITQPGWNREGGVS